MSTTQLHRNAVQNKPGHIPTRGKRPLAGVVVASTFMMLAGSAFTATPAIASTSLHGCTVTPLKPISSQALGAVWADYPVRVKCEGGRKVIVEQKRYERDSSVDDPQGRSFIEHVFWPFSGQETKHSNHAVHLTDDDGRDEILHKVRFMVIKDDRPGKWSEWESSPIHWVHFF